MIRITLGSRIRIRIRGKSWISIRIKVKIPELQRLVMEPWRAVDDHNDHNEGVGAQKGALEGL